MKAYKSVVITAILVAVLSLTGYYVIRKERTEKRERTNHDCRITERLFDLNDKLSEYEEEYLRDLITECEETLSMDIVIITIDSGMDLSPIGLSYDYYGSSQELAEYVCEYYKLGWEDWSTNHNEPTSSIVIVANWTTGDAWMCTSGRAMSAISDSEASSIVQKGCRYLRYEPLKGFEIMLNDSVSAITGVSSKTRGKLVYAVIAAMAISLIFFLMNFSKRAGRDTTTCETYVEGGQANVLQRQDVFLRKHVTQTTISSSGGSGGGGGHSSGGGSHGGGGGHF